jgi:hypothetical protein
MSFVCVHIRVYRHLLGTVKGLQVATRMSLGLWQFLKCGYGYSSFLHRLHALLSLQFSYTSLFLFFSCFFYALTEFSPISNFFVA